MTASINRSRMLRRSLVGCICVSVLAGCAHQDEPKPRIVSSLGRSESELVQPRPGVAAPAPSERSAGGSIPSGWLPPPEVERTWAAIVIHHSGTSSGNAEIFDKWHREGNHWEGVGYDFVIGNGTDSRDGQVEVTFRWREQRTGAHCKTPGNWANENAVGICLVGNFEHAAPTARQMRSLVSLTRFLQERYRIPNSRVYGHNTTPGALATECPGRQFPMARLKSMLGY